MNKSTNKYKTSRLRGRAGVEQRKRIRERDRYACQHCNRPVRIGEVDHITSLEDGGSNDDSNLHLLCSVCHAKKTAQDRGYVVREGCTASGEPLGDTHHWNV